MKLTIRERLAMDAALPQRGNYTTMIAVKEIKSKTAITMEEIKQYTIKFGENQVTWSDEGSAYEIDVEFGKTLSVVINEALQTRNKANELTEDMATLYGKFVIPPTIEIVGENKTEA